MSWKISVCPWVSNFSRGKNLQTTLNGAATAGGSTFTVNDTNVALYCKRGDVLELGPSTNASYLGKTEFVRVVSVSSATVTISGTLANSYATTNPVKGIVTGAPEGVDYTTFSGAPITSYGINQRHSTNSTAQGLPYEGYLNSYTGYWWKHTADATNIPYSIMRTQAQVLNGLKYRFALHARQQTAPTGTCQISMRANTVASPTTIATITLPTGATSAWTKYEAMSSALSGISQNDCHMKTILSAISTDSGVVALDCCYLSHAWNCGATAQNAGYYTIPKNPSQVLFDTPKTATIVRDRYGRPFFRDSLDAVVPVDLDLTWIDATEEMLKVFGMMEYWQNQEHFVCIESNDFTMQGAYQPRPMFGYITWRYLFGDWDITRIGVQLSFQGVL